MRQASGKNLASQRHLALLWPLASAALLVAAAGSIAMRKPAEADAYHDLIRRIAADIPMVIGSWHSRDVPVPAPAVRILDPNVLISRRYTHLQTNQSFTLLFVQSRDAYDMVYHYPPNCFRHGGWTRQWHQERSWPAGDRSIGLIEYGFSKRQFNGDDHIIVGNFIALSTGLALDMPAIEEAARDPSRRPFGAAQVQIVFDANVPLDARQQAVADIVPAFLPAIDAIQQHAALHPAATVRPRDPVEP
jgi:hypothetical protein